MTLTEINNGIVVGLIVLAIQRICVDIKARNNYLEILVMAVPLGFDMI